MTKYIYWKPWTWFTGRNGTFHCSGVEIIDTGQTIIITPLTSKNKVANAGLAIPKESVPEFIEKLQMYE